MSIEVIEILAVKLWGASSLLGDPSIKRYSVYYKREGRMFRGLVDAVDELSAWRKFHETVDHKNTLITPLSEQEQEYHGYAESRAQAEESQD